MLQNQYLYQLFLQKLQENKQKTQNFERKRKNMADTGFASHIVFFVCFTLKNMSQLKSQITF